MASRREEPQVVVGGPVGHPVPWWKAVWHLVVEVWVGSALFAILFAPAVFLDLGIHQLEASQEVSAFLLILLAGTKYTIAILDAILYLVFMVNMAWRFLTELRWGRANHE